MAAQESYAWHCTCGRLCGKKHTHCPTCKTHWSVGVPHSNTPKSHRTYAPHENWGWDWEEDNQRGRGHGKKNSGKGTRSASARAREAKGQAKGSAKGQAKGQGKGHQTETISPFSSSAPWPSSESTMSSPFQQHSTFAPAPIPTEEDNAELVLSIREMYPDITKAPARMQAAVARSEKTSAKQLTSGLNKSSKSVGNAAKELKALREARARHRERWLQHLKDAVTTWEQQLKLYQEQQSNYSKLIRKAQQELQAARQTLEMLNKKAADTAGDEESHRSAADQDAQENADTEAELLVNQVQAVLQSCARVAIKDEVMEVSDSEETSAAPAKRPRSLEPFGGAGGTAPLEAGK
eukprot:s386_g44.t1